MSGKGDEWEGMEQRRGVSGGGMEQRRGVSGGGMEQRRGVSGGGMEQRRGVSGGGGVKRGGERTGKGGRGSMLRHACVHTGYTPPLHLPTHTHTTGGLVVQLPSLTTFHNG